MDNIINYGTFVDHITYLLKLTIFVNKGTDDEEVLENSILLYNQLATINKDKIDEDDEKIIRQVMKRFNLSLKLDNGACVDIRDKNNQLKMTQFDTQVTLSTGNLKKFNKWSEENKIAVVGHVPMKYMLREGQFQKLIWHYIRAVFYITQILISKSHPGEDPNDPKIIRRKEIYDESCTKFQEILPEITKQEELTNAQKLLSLDAFLNSKLMNTGLNNKSIESAKTDINKMLLDGGVQENSTVTKMIESITEQVQTTKIGNGNVIKNMVKIAQNVAKDLRKETHAGNAESLKTTLMSISNIFQNYCSNNMPKDQSLPPQVKDVLTMIQTKGSSEEKNEILDGLKSICEQRGLNQEDFINSIKGQNGEIDVEKFDDYFKKEQKEPADKVEMNEKPKKKKKNKK